MSDWFNYPQNGASGLVRPWWRFLNDRQILTDPITSVPRVQFGRDDGYTVTRNDLDTLYVGLDVFGAPAVPPGANSDDVEADIDVTFPRPTPDPLVGQVWMGDDGTGTRLARMVIAVEGDGSAGTLVRFPEPPTGPPGFSGPWTFKTNTAVNPPAGDFRMDNVLQPLTTALYIPELDSLGNDRSIAFGIVAVGNRITIDGGGDMVTFLVSGPPVDNGTWWTFPVAWESDTGEVPNNTLCAVDFAPASAPIEVYEVGTNWPPTDYILVAGPSSPWAPVPIPVIP